jgi:hypothetical protein
VPDGEPVILFTHNPDIVRALLDEWIGRARGRAG